MFGEDEIHLRLWFKAVFVRKEIGKCWSKGKAKTEIYTAQRFSLKNEQMNKQLRASKPRTFTVHTEIFSLSWVKKVDPTVLTVKHDQKPER